MLSFLNTQVYGLPESTLRSALPLLADINNLSHDIDKHLGRAKKLASVNPGTGHDKFLRGIIVQFDLIAPRYFYQELDTYHFHESVSSQSTMHCITKFDIDKMVDFRYIDEIILNRFKELVELYKDNPCEHNLLIVKNNMPEGLHLCRGVSTNYAQIKTMALQRHSHQLPEWRVDFMNWVKELPMSNELITNTIGGI